MVVLLVLRMGLAFGVWIAEFVEFDGLKYGEFATIKLKHGRIHGSGGELVQRDIILDVFGNEGAVFRRHSFEVTGGEHRVGGQVGELFALDDSANLVVRDICLEVILDGRNGFGLVGFVVGDELGELLFQEFILGLEPWNEAEDLFQDFPECQATVHGGGFTQFVERIVLLRLIEDLPIDIVYNPIPLSGLDGLSNILVLTHGVFELLEEHAVDLHAVFVDLLFLNAGENVLPQVLVGASHHDWSRSPAGFNSLV
jgi:hypothetical protein